MSVPCLNAGQYARIAVTTGNIYVFSTCGATYDTRITLYNNAGGGSIGFNDDFCGLQSQVTWVATYTGQLRVLVDRYVNFFNTCAHSGGCAPLSITCSSPPPPMTNDNCGGAIVLPVIENCFVQNFTNVGATASGTTPAPTCSSAPNTDIWFQFTAPASGVVRINSNSVTLNDGAMQLYSGTCGSLALVPNGCDDDSGPGLMPDIDRRCDALTPGATYYIRYWGYNNSSGIFDLCVRGPEFFPTPAEDCAGGITVCGSQAINNSADYTGCSVDLNITNRGCLSAGERQGTWYYFSPQSLGTMAFVLQPTNSSGNPVNVDYDFAIWGPMNTIACPPATFPLRCTWAYPPNVPGYPGNVAYQTGLSAGNLDLSEPDWGPAVNGFVRPIAVGAGNIGQIYVMYVDNFDITGQSFNLTWNLSTPDMLDCTVLPVELIEFNALALKDRVLVSWKTQTESNSDRYIIEHSIDAERFDPIGHVIAAGTSLETIDYEYFHEHPRTGINYYRLKQLDLDGSHTYSSVAPVEFKSDNNVLLPRPNPANSSIQIDLPVGYSDQVVLNIFDGSGRMVRVIRVALANEPSFVNIPVGDLDAGIYSIHLFDRQENQIGSGRFMKE
ncbi:MAG: T9SS type A sorting domain-containing protein [Flavobacteriales bacterium]|nr:T9SS type A sorting domain-containing protein [Flavobacteriales bacterium]